MARKTSSKPTAGFKAGARKVTTKKESIETLIVVGDREFHFPPDLFDLDSVNIGELSRQAESIPGLLAQCGVALGEAERQLARAEQALSLWMANHLQAVGGDSKMSETAKRNLMLDRYSEQYQKQADQVTEMSYTVRVLRSYREGVQAKLQLAQTLSANLRRESEAYRSGAN